MPTLEERLEAATGAQATPPAPMPRTLEERLEGASQGDIQPIEGGREPYSGAILPFTRDETGDISFDSDAGILGVIKRALMAPGDAMMGDLDPTSEEGIKRALEAALIMSPVSPVSRMPGSVFYPKGSQKTVQPKPPSRQALKAASDAQYKAADALGVEYKGASISRFADDLERGLNEKGFIAELAPEVHSLIRTIKNAPAGSTVKLQSLDAFRKRMGDLAGSPDKTKASAASIAINAVDDFIRAADEAATVVRTPATGQPAIAGARGTAPRSAAREAADTIEAARGNAAAGFRSDQITGLEDVMGLRAAAANSGRNIDNAARQRLTSLLTRKKDIRGFSPEEQAAIRDIINGRPTKNAARYIGNLLGGGGGLGAFLTTIGLGGVGGAVGGGVGAAAGAGVPMVAGALAKTLANRMTKAEIKALDAMVRARSPLGASQVPKQIYAPSPLQGKTTGALLGAILSQRENR